MRLIFQPCLTAFISVPDSVPRSWSLYKRIKPDSTGRHPPQPAPTGQVGSRFPCYTPRITHFLTIKPSQIHCQVIIYTEASQSEADPPFSDFTSPSVWQRSGAWERKAAAPLRSVMGETLWPSCFASHWTTSELLRKCVLNYWSVSSPGSSRVPLKWKKQAWHM